MRQLRKPPGTPLTSSPAEEIKAIDQGFAANFGRWSFNEVDKTITYHVEGAFFPNIEGMEFNARIYRNAAQSAPVTVTAIFGFIIEYADKLKAFVEAAFHNPALMSLIDEIVRFLAATFTTGI